MLAQVTLGAVVGLDDALVDVQVYISNGQAGMTVVGLPDASVQESRERVRAAIRNSNLRYPGEKRITVNSQIITGIRDHNCSANLET
ncbi:MAG: hypothetical protein HY327_10465 [Chloroflexi bacterium]|nr:hypothetical protein [Chloroflexota bacterium]